MEKTDCCNRKYERKITSTKTAKKGLMRYVVSAVIVGTTTKSSSVKSLKDKAVLRKLGACRKCLGCHDEGGYCRDTFLCRNKDCKRGGGAPDHHFFLSPKGEGKRGEEERREKYRKGERTLMEEQDQVLSELADAGKLSPIPTKPQ